MTILSWRRWDRLASLKYTPLTISDLKFPYLLHATMNETTSIRYKLSPFGPPLAFFIICHTEKRSQKTCYHGGNREPYNEFSFDQTQ